MHPAAPLWSCWIDDAYVAVDAIHQAGRALRAAPTPAAHLPGFWRHDQLAALKGAVQDLSWERLLVLREGDAVRQVDQDTFAASGAESRFSRHDRAVQLDLALNDLSVLRSDARNLLRQFVAFAVVTPGMASWLAELLDCGPLTATSLEFSRYHSGDFIAEHSDAVGSRVCNLVTYFDDDRGRAGAGALHVHGPQGGGRRFRPRFNDVVVLPIAEGNRHFVAPWSGPVGRHTVSIAFSTA